MRTWFTNILSRISLPRDVVLTLFSIAISWAITHIYYQQSISDLQADITERKYAHQLLLRGIESIGTVQYQRDAGGNIIGVKVQLKGSVSTESTASGSLQ